MNSSISTDNRKKLRHWELALLLGVALAALIGVRLDGTQSALADRVIRLHVIANSDSDADQALKLQVRDRILEEAADLVAEGATLEEAEAAVTAQLETLAQAGSEVVQAEGYDYAVSASLEHDVDFPTKEYGDFSLPAGSYTALRIIIGEGDGRNWWCVVFPPLCLGSVTETTAETALNGGFSQDQVSLITGEDEGYIVKFKAIELLDQFKGWLSER